MLELTFILAFYSLCFQDIQLLFEIFYFFFYLVKFVFDVI